MKLNPRTVLPPNGTLCFVVSDGRKSGFGFDINRTVGFVGIALFEDGKWYSMPTKDEMSDNHNFMWVE